MRIVIQRPDLDTCLAGAILGVQDGDPVIFRAEGATAAELADPAVICLEAGGSGQVEFGNFDHHDPGLDLPPAATQAYVSAGRPLIYIRLVEYNEMIDLCLPSPLRPPFPSVSSLISGIRFVHEADPVRQFREGVRALRHIAQAGFDPFDPLPFVAEWAPYLEEKSRRLSELMQSPPAAEMVNSGGTKIAFSATTLVGAVGALYRQGVDVAVVARPLDPAGAWKYTIAGRQLKVSHLLGALNRLEPGWGGPAHGTIIGSPVKGSRLPMDAVRAIVLSGFTDTAAGERNDESEPDKLDRPADQVERKHDLVQRG